MGIEIALANWLVDMIDTHVRYFRDQFISICKICWIDVQLAWCDVKIWFYS
jgi:hypothetical protein